MKLTKIASLSGLILCSMILPCGLLDDFDFNEGTTTYESFTISSTQIGPYEAFCEDPEITFTVLYKDVGTYRPRFSCDFNNETKYVKFNPSFSTTTRFETYTYTYTPPTSSSLSNAGMKITFAIYDSQNVECLTSIDINVKTLSSTSYKTSTNSKLSLNNNGFAYKVSNNKVTNLNEIIKCSDFKDYFDIDY